MSAPGETLVYDDFARGDWPGEKWFKHRMPDYDMWDAGTTVSCADGALAIEVPRFTLARNDFHDHVKALIYSTADFSPGPGGLISVEVDMAVTTFGTASNPFGAEAGDVRLASGAFTTIDLKTAIVFDFFVSNTRIVPLYERLPFAVRDDNKYPLFTELIPTDLPTWPNEWHRYAIRYDRAHDTVEWLVDGARVARRERVGAPHGQTGPVVKLDALKIGGGLFTLLDDLENDRLRTGDGVKTPGLDPRFEQTVFGQGARVAFRNFTVARA